MNSLDLKKVQFENSVKKLNRMAIIKYSTIGNFNESSVPAIATMIILMVVIPNPPKAVPIVNLDTTDYER